MWRKRDETVNRRKRRRAWESEGDCIPDTAGAVDEDDAEACKLKTRCESKYDALWSAPPRVASSATSVEPFGLNRLDLTIAH